MNKLFTKIAGLSLGLAMAIGVGVAVGSSSKKVAPVHADEDFNVDTTISTLIAANGWEVSSGSTVKTKIKSLPVNDDITITTNGTASNEGSFWGTSPSNDWRLYNGGNTSGTAAGEITISAATGCTIVDYTYTYSTSNSGVLATERGASIASAKRRTSGTKITVNASSHSLFVAKTNAGTNGQVRITRIVVNYTKESSDTLNSINLAATSKGTTALESATVKTDKTLQVYLTANYSSSGAVDKTNDATWTATAGTGTASVTKGLITGLTVGTVTISASYGGKDAVSLTLTVTQGPKVTLSRAQFTPFHEKESDNSTTISTTGFSGTVAYSASSNSANLTASIVNTNHVQIVAANNIPSDETVTVTVTGNDGNDTASAELKVYLKAPVFTLSGTELSVKPGASSTITVTTNYFLSDVTITAPSGAPAKFSTSVSGSTITITGIEEGSGSITVTATDGTITRTGTISVTVADVLEYELVTDDSTLTADSQLIIASTVSSNSYAMGAQSSSLRSSVSVTVADNKIAGPSSDVKIVTLEGESGAWYLKVDDGYLSYSGSSNNISTSATKGSACTWTISISSNNATIRPSSATTRLLSYNSSQPRFCVYGSVQNNIQLYGILASEKQIVSSRMVNGTVSAKTGDNEWTVDGFKFFVTYEGESETEVTSATTFNVTESVPTITESGTMQVTVTPTYKSVAYTAKAAEVTATLTFVDQYAISRLYDIELALNGTQANITCDGIYMGYITHTRSSTTYYDLFIGNGDYGMEVYETTTNPSSYTIGETYLTVTGTLKNYNYLYEMTSATVTVLTDATRKSHISSPSTYVVDGTESASTMYLASRVTSLSGTVYSIGGSTTAGTTATSGSNNSIYITVGGNNVLLYVKAAQATSDVASKFVVGDPITVEGFTTYYNNSGATFEVLFEKVVEAEANYHAADFAKELLKNTKSYCNSSYDGSDQKTVLTSVWTALATDGWLKIQAGGETSTLVNGTPDPTIVVPEGVDASATDALIDAMTDADAIAAALYRYDYCTAKYNLTNFMQRSLTVSFANGLKLAALALNKSASTTIAIITISAVSLAAIGGYFLFRKKKEN